MLLIDTIALAAGRGIGAVPGAAPPADGELMRAARRIEQGQLRDRGECFRGR